MQRSSKFIAALMLCGILIATSAVPSTASNGHVRSHTITSSEAGHCRARFDIYERKAASTAEVSQGCTFARPMRFAISPTGMATYVTGTLRKGMSYTNSVPNNLTVSNGQRAGGGAVQYKDSSGIWRATGWYWV